VAVPAHGLQQERVLGVAGWRSLRALGIKTGGLPSLNQARGYSALLERARSYMEGQTSSCSSQLVTRAGKHLQPLRPSKLDLRSLPPEMAKFTWSSTRKKSLALLFSTPRLGAGTKDDNELLIQHGLVSPSADRVW